MPAIKAASGESVLTPMVIIGFLLRPPPNGYMLQGPSAVLPMLCHGCQGRPPTISGGERRLAKSGASSRRHRPTARHHCR